MTSDLSIMKGLKNKSEESFRVLYDKYFRLVYYQAYLVLHSKEDSEDVTQDVFFKFYTKIDGLPMDLNIKSYVALMAKNSAIDLYRKNQKKEVLIDPDSIPEPEDSSLLLDSFNGILEKDESIIITLRLNFNYSFKEIALDLHQTVNTVQAKYYKGIKKIRKSYLKGVNDEK